MDNQTDQQGADGITVEPPPHVNVQGSHTPDVPKLADAIAADDRIRESPDEEPPAPTTEQLEAIAQMVLELVEMGAGGMDLGLCRAVVFRLRTSLDHMYPASVWSDDTVELGGRFAWALRARIAPRLAELQQYAGPQE